MGQTLSEPVTNKETAVCQDEFYKVKQKDESLFVGKLFGFHLTIALYKL